MRILILRILFLLYFLLYANSMPACAIYTHDQIPDIRYVEAGQQFHAVVKVNVLDEKGRIKASGSGTLVKHERTGKVFVLTASHVLRDGATYHIKMPAGTFAIQKIFHFEDFIVAKYAKDVAITVSDARTGQRLFGVRLTSEQEPLLQQALRSYGLDLAVALIGDISLPDIEPYTLADSASSLPSVNERYWAVGFGESGAGSGLGGLAAFIGGSGIKKAFNPRLAPYYYLTFTHLLSGEKQIVTLLGSVFEDDPKNQLAGQVGPGDSGGPVLQPHKDGSWQVRGVICSNVPRIHTKAFQQEKSWWSHFMRKIGKIGEHRAPLSYLFWQEGNIYGSEAHYIDVASPLVQEWIAGL
jgi:hypothetical protein